MLVGPCGPRDLVNSVSTITKHVNNLFVQQADLAASWWSAGSHLRIQLLASDLPVHLRTTSEVQKGLRKALDTGAGLRLQELAQIQKLHALES